MHVNFYAKWLARGLEKRVGEGTHSLGATGQHDFAEHIFWRNVWLTLEQRLYIWFPLKAREILVCFLNWNKSTHCFSGQLSLSTCSTVLLLRLSSCSTCDSRGFNSEKSPSVKLRKSSTRKSRGEKERKKEEERYKNAFLHVVILADWYRKE